ncbi:hypothetical protein [Pseudoalteromonas luteoviolacea]|uniref:Lipoprotein n=1 Tax=Pseudoalteromonas luteoviolacea H33 TaxID=1365251 RepID=A0A167DRY5_9GAMM|nr:hypothetical protein [Pseudoalteromonas luteoviolacea]KZN49271.1 hypothetical protein N476_19680 [Pseudoalteromonas luteoviolacea H33]KZN74926.1 hypothetical protein N477_21110 [Pseudoalteromonas luteoviolacea H33-S]MBQ4878374.1 hypothetical protein [Pseudoalteromonas luteoviolacea]MBQ4907529.1 hypothetical protein [Pseudoalteromonas luteoviolacea]
MFTPQLKSLTVALLCSSLFTACGGNGGTSGPSIQLDSKTSNNIPSSDNKSQADTGSDQSNNNVDNTKPPVTTEENRYARRGRVIDGYVSGATVWLDLNSNAQQDKDEPFAISTDKGSYQLELTQEQEKCAAYVPTYVDVPVGAIDEDLGEVTKAYKMVLPPTLNSIENSEMLHITPLTTVLWQSLDKTDEFNNSTCAEIIANNQLKEQLQIVMQESTAQVIEHYNISEEQLFSDYIENGDESLQKLAEDIVKGLQASIEKHLALAKEYLDAHEIRVLHYQDTPSEQSQSNQLVWYRRVLIFGEGDQTIVDETVRMDDDLEDVLFVHYDRKIEQSPWGEGHSYSRTVDMVKNSSEDLGLCHYSEKLSFTIDGITYSLDNYKSVDRTSQQQLCDNDVDFSDAVYRGLSVDYSKGSINYLAEFTQDSNTKTDLDDWINLGDKPNILDILILVLYFAQSGFEFDNDVTIPFFSWHKRITDDSGDNRVTTSKHSDGTWTRHTYEDDGTYVMHCSTDGETWKSCEKQN